MLYISAIRTPVVIKLPLSHHRHIIGCEQALRDFKPQKLNESGESTKIGARKHCCKNPGATPAISDIFFGYCRTPQGDLQCDQDTDPRKLMQWLPWRTQAPDLKVI